MTLILAVKTGVIAFFAIQHICKYWENTLNVFHATKMSIYLHNRIILENHQKQ